MSPDRKTMINGHKIEEFWWAGSFCCYVDNMLSEWDYDKAVKYFSADPSTEEKEE